MTKGREVVLPALQSLRLFTTKDIPMVLNRADMARPNHPMQAEGGAQ